MSQTTTEDTHPTEVAAPPAAADAARAAQIAKAEAAQVAFRNQAIELAELKGKLSSSRLYLTINLVAIVLLIGAVLTAYSEGWPTSAKITVWTLLLAGVFGIFATAGTYGVVIEKYRRAESALEISRQLLPDSSSTGDYFQSLATINGRNLSDYYFLAKRQTNASFWVAVGTGLLGFGLITFGLSFAFREQNAKEMFTLVSSGSGVITEFIAGVFFYLYNRTVQQLRGYHESLLRVQNVLLSFHLVERVMDAQKPEMMKSMLEYLMHQDVAVSVGAVPKPPKPLKKSLE